MNEEKEYIESRIERLNKDIELFKTHIGNQDEECRLLLNIKKTI